jgi:rhomboid protease GluP
MVRRFWRATADFTAGRDDEARAELTALRDSADRQVAVAAERRLARPPRPPHLGQAAVAEVDALAARLAEERRFGAAARPTPARATLVLLAANLAMFAAEVALGGATDDATLFRLGALEPSAVAAGGWWRVVAATFLHFGALHLALNMVGLLVLGRWLEQALGAARWLLVWLAASIGGNLANLALVHFHVIPPQVLVGASGGVMGLVGATGALFLRGWAGEGSRLARRRLGAIAAIVLLQVAFDLVTPNVSFVAHSGGLVAGFALALLLRHRREG